MALPPARTAGIPTFYKGIQFRSRLEAQWAATLDLLEWEWDYEPFDCKGWIPDFVLKGALPILLDAKPVATFAECAAFGQKIVDSEPPYPVAIVGAGRLPLEGTNCCIGSFVAVGPDKDHPMALFDGHDLSIGKCCGKRDGMVWSTEWGGWHCGICGDWGKIYHDFRREFDDLWRRAKEESRWSPK